MYGLIGYPLGHSFSANFFNKKFADEDIDEEYRLFPLENIGELTGLLSEHPDLKGLNVTIPYKSKVIPYLNSLDEDAEKIGAVNVIKIDPSGSLKGYNTDAVGFRQSLRPLLHPNIREALVLGTGGASKAVAHVLEQLGISPLKVSRHPSEGEISYAEITPELIAGHRLIVNTTPLGMWPKTDEAPDIPYHLLTPHHVCYDLVYNPETTEFMRRAAKYGAVTKNGLEMLHLQALAAWDIWQTN